VMDVSSNSSYSNIPYDWKGLDYGTFVWTLPGEGIENDTVGNTTDNSTDGNTTDNSTDGNTTDNSTDGNTTDNSTDGNTTDNSTDGNSTGNSTDNSTDGNSTGNSTDNSIEDTEPDIPAEGASELPGFTAWLSVMSLVGAAMVSGRYRKLD